jgi:hypothetical protein
MAPGVAAGPPTPLREDQQQLWWVVPMCPEQIYNNEVGYALIVACIEPSLTFTIPLFKIIMIYRMLMNCY